MLKGLKVRNFAIIDEVEIEFGEGLNIISGETGAGKSILMDALLLILGGRASANLIRSGAEEASVEALFRIGDDDRLRETLEGLGLAGEDDELIVRRIVHSSGKNRVYINGSMANISTLQAVTTRLVDLCSQHDQQLLASAEEQLLWIDRFGGFEAQRAKLRCLHSAWKEKQRELDALSTDSSQREQRIDFLRFQIQELDEAAVQGEDEDLKLEQELKLLENSESLYAFAAEAEELLNGAEGNDTPGLLAGVGALSLKVRTLSALDPKLNQAKEFLDALKVNAEELAHFTRSYSAGVTRDEGRIEAINSRLALLSKLKKKYGPALADCVRSLESFRSELSALENHSGSLGSAMAALEHAKNNLLSQAKTLSKSRQRAAADFSKLVGKELAELHMDRARFLVEITALDEAGPTGIDAARFQIAANPGEPLGALSKVASGGELSRIMLAMHNVVSRRGGVGVYLFDEVDAGIGGKTAVSVGAKLQRVASGNQVICITHLPQVAAFASHHLRVEKRIVKKAGAERTAVSVVPLKADERELEIARMLGGLDNDKTARANAKTMLMNAKRTGKGRGEERAKDV